MQLKNAKDLMILLMEMLSVEKKIKKFSTLMKKFGSNVIKVLIWLVKKTSFVEKMANGNHNHSPNVLGKVSFVTADIKSSFALKRSHKHVIKNLSKKKLCIVKND